MHYRRLGKSGIKVSEIALGSWVTFGNQLDEKKAQDMIHAAYDQGINFFDNADMYANGKAEILMGEAIKDLPREALVISSKVFWPTFPGPNGKGLSRKHILESVHASLKRLQTDYLDLYFCHRYDPDTPLEEVARAMHDLVTQGKILYWGTSKWTAAQIQAVYGASRQSGLTPLTMEQPQYNMLARRSVEADLPAVVKELGIGLTTFSPLAYGILSGKYNDGIPGGSRASLEEMSWIKDRITPEVIGKVRQLTEMAQELGITTAQLAIAWILRRKEVSAVITGASRIEQMDENLGGAQAVEKLTNDVLEKIDHILGNQPEEE